MYNVYIYIYFESFSYINNIFIQGLPHAKIICEIAKFQSIHELDEKSENWLNK